MMRVLRMFEPYFQRKTYAGSSRGINLQNSDLMSTCTDVYTC